MSGGGAWCPSTCFLTPNRSGHHSTRSHGLPRADVVPFDLLPDDRSLRTPLDSVAWPATSEGADPGALRLAALAQGTIRLAGRWPAMSERAGLWGERVEWCGREDSVLTGGFGSGQFAYFGLKSCPRKTRIRPNTRSKPPNQTQQGRMWGRGSVPRISWSFVANTPSEVPTLIGGRTSQPAPSSAS